MDNNIAFMHYRSYKSGLPDCKGGATVAIKPGDTDGKIVVSVARCGRDEIFKRKMGRTIALGRMRAALQGRETPWVFEVDVEDGQTMKQAAASVLNPRMAKFGLM